MSRRSKAWERQAWERADVEKAAASRTLASFPAPVPDAPTGRLESFMMEVSHLLRFQWQATRSFVTPDVVVVVGRARGVYEFVQGSVYVDAAEIERAPQHVLDRLRRCERQIVEALDYQCLVREAMLEMEPPYYQESARPGVWRPADLASLKQDGPHLLYGSAVPAKDTLMDMKTIQKMWDDALFKAFSAGDIYDNKGGVHR